MVERGEEERCCESVKPDQPVPRMRIRGFVGGDGEGKEVLGRFDGVDEEVVEERGRLERGAGVDWGELGSDEVWERVVGAMSLRMER